MIVIVTVARTGQLILHRGMDFILSPCSSAVVGAFLGSGAVMNVTATVANMVCCLVYVQIYTCVERCQFV
ncbi:hypothetical protein BJ878DRAFT_501393 [Calycina marina]|uniref:Uncharacterized protein n=1 Tax=Calycina marina TaxID=1763456 RepID=A0A9P8CFS6_9HELO|nr:hypothetical protein BJ878DRAFT_501393 [Calycina marina]